MTDLDANGNRALDGEETIRGLLPEAFRAIDANADGVLSEAELTRSLDRVADQLPNLAVPEMNGVGAMEICVSVAEGVCDFISAMDTARIQEWNCWYHILNCGFPLKVSGETDFPCMSGTRVGQGRVYVRLGAVDRVDFGAWCDGLAKGRSYVSDGFAHALAFTVNGSQPGFDDVHLDRAGDVRIKATVAFAPELPVAVAYGTEVSKAGKRTAGDTVNLHGPRSTETVKGGRRLVEVVVNGVPVASQHVPADGATHELEWTVPIRGSSWVALRHFPQMHTNPVNVLLAGRPIRASRKSAEWCIETIKQLWRARSRRIAPSERPVADETFQRAMARYHQIAAEAPPDS